MGVARIASHDQAELPLSRPGHVLPGHERRQTGFPPGTEKDFYLAGRRRETGAQIDGGICERDGTVPEILHGDTSPFQLEAPDIFQRLAGQVLQPQTAGQLSQDPPVRPGIETDIRSRAAHDEGRLAAALDLEQGSRSTKDGMGSTTSLNQAVSDQEKVSETISSRPASWAFCRSGSGMADRGSCLRVK